MTTEHGDLTAEQLIHIDFFTTETYQDELTNKLFMRLKKNFTPAQLDEIEESAIVRYGKDLSNYRD